ncbi:polyphosphate kinase 1 [Halococcus sp. IIIV-5B]|uniref:polyphosphate kinase 1 n=1 Tax=Halococcus sp. IIIV-5B TaxID=2321230 RepID=UPI000E734ECF|nr:polyphosphate kinase 1 [Halococcus sp. IIIV-5B]RJT03150.1 polyphosphate kinase 1 [Halococcus sp. IIIV-5B]
MPESASQPTATSGEDVDLSDSEFYLNRELSQLEFQRRVLHEALDERTPLLERVRFLALFTKNMDEFFMKRVGGLEQQMEADVAQRTPDGRTPTEQWKAVLETARPLFEAQTECYHETIHPALAEAGIHIRSWEELSADDQSAMRAFFEESVLPTLTPLTFDPAHPFPFISNLSLSLGVRARRQRDDKETFTRIKVPPNQSRLIAVEAGERYVLLEDVIKGNLDLLLPNVDVLEVATFRLTRNAEVRRDEEVAEDLMAMIEEVIEERRFATVVRLEAEAEISGPMLDLLMDELDLDDREVFLRRGPLGFREFTDLLDLDRPDLKRDPWTPQPHPRLAETHADHDGTDDTKAIFDEIRRDDILVHHPYHSFTKTVQRFLDEAATDPDVRAIKAAIYRTASDSKVIESLIEAAANGKQVAVMVELKARFDEQNNLEWVRKLEENGIHVAYGTIGLKTHTKTALVVREERDGMGLYSHIATGNYHSETAKGYVDLGLLTADRDIGRDLVKLFNFYTGPTLDEEFRELLIAPVTMRAAFTRMIRREADHAREGRDARIVAKMNALEDPEIVEELYRASMEGVDIDLVVRDICRLRPGIEGISETVSVHSVVGRFLEHSRIYYFENGGDPEYYTGSADWMTRNLDSRVEAVTPVEDPAIRKQLRFVLDVMRHDNRKRWEMAADGSYTQCRPGADEPVVNTQAVLMARTLEDGNGTDTADDSMPHPGLRSDLLVEPEVSPSDDRATETETEDTDRATDPSGTPTKATAQSDDTPAETHDLPDPMRVHSERWYVPDSRRYAFAVRTPDDGREYRSTPEAAAALLTKYYGDGSAADD